MNSEQVAAVLAKVQLGDNRDVDGLVLAEWEDTIGHLPFEDCVDAVRMHRQESTAYLTTAHVVANVRLVQKREERDERVRQARERGAIAGPVSTFDREQHELAFKAALSQARVAKGLDPETGLPIVSSS